MTLTDYIPHGLVVTLAGVVTWVARDHMKRDDIRFDGIKADIGTVTGRLTEVADTMASNHAEILRLLIDQKNQAATNAAIAEATATRNAR